MFRSMASHASHATAKTPQSFTPELGQVFLFFSFFFSLFLLLPPALEQAMEQIRNDSRKSLTGWSLSNHVAKEIEQDEW